MTMPTNATAIAASLEASRRRPTLLPGEATLSLDVLTKMIRFNDLCAFYRDQQRQCVNIAHKQERVREICRTAGGNRLWNTQLGLKQALASKNADQIKKKEQQVRDAEATVEGKRLLFAQDALKQALADQLGPDADWSEVHQKAALRVFGNTSS